MSDKELLKRYLGQYRIAKKRTRVLKARLRQVQIDLDIPLSAVKYSDMPKGTDVSEGVAPVVLRKIEIEERLTEQLSKTADTLSRVMEFIEYLPSMSAERSVLEYRYIDNMSWVAIERELNYSRSGCFKIFDNSLDKLLAFDGVRITLDDYKKELNE